MIRINGGQSGNKPKGSGVSKVGFWLILLAMVLMMISPVLITYFTRLF